MKKGKNKKTRKSIVLTPEQLEKRAKSAFKKKIVNTFQSSGFSYIPTNDNEMHIGFRTVEVDALFIYENIWLICEDTTTKPKNIRDHIRTKNEAFGEVKRNMASFIDELVKLFPDKEVQLRKYDPQRIKAFGLYITKEEIELSDDDYKLFPELIFVQPKTLNYFQWISQCIRHSARNEVFRFLGIKNTDIGPISSSTNSAEIVAPIIYPKSFTGLKNNVRIVSFMMSAEDLLNTCYVMRKDNWSDSIWLYQRLIDKAKIKGIRSFLETKGEAFYNNIIVGLPDSVRFRDGRGDYKTIDQIGDLEGDCRLVFPKEMNSISVISINGFIIALTRQLSVNGVQDYEYYDRVFNGWDCDFSKEGFAYTSSQYRKFSTQILQEAFKIEDAVIETI